MSAAPVAGIHCRLDELLELRGITLVELARRVGITVANLSILKNNRAKAIRFSTLIALCEELDCDVADLFVFEPGAEPGDSPSR